MNALWGNICHINREYHVSVSFGIKFIRLRRDQKKHRNAEACRKLLENTILVSFEIKYIRRDQKQRRNGEACRASPTFFLVEPDKLDIKKH